MIAIPCALTTLDTIFLSLIFANLKAEKCHLTVYFVLCYEFSLLNLMCICFSLPLNDQFWPFPVFLLACFYLSDSYYAPFMLLPVFENVPCKEQGTGLTVTLRDGAECSYATRSLEVYSCWLLICGSVLSAVGSLGFLFFLFLCVVCFFLLDYKIFVPVASVLFIRKLKLSSNLQGSL